MRLIIILSLFLTSCSFIPRVTFDKPNTLPQVTEKSERRIRCYGDIILDEFGKVKSCTKGFKQNESVYNKKERKITFQERVANFISNLTGSLFWVSILLIIFLPGAFGFIISRLFNGAEKALLFTIRGINRAKHNGGRYLEELKKEHSKDKEVLKIINSLKAKVSSEE